MSAQKKKFWGWGFEGESVGDDEAKLVFAEIVRRHGEIADAAAGVPSVGDFDLRAPRVEATGAAARLTTDDLKQ